MKRVKAILLSVFSVVSSLTFAQNPNTSCADMIPICTDDLLQFNIFNTGGGLVPGNDYDCLVPTVGTNWFYLKIGNSGNIDMTMTAPVGFDLDFAVWGPFANLAAAQAACGNLGKAPNPLGTVDCSALGGNTESISIPNATSGQVYVMLITIPASSSTTTFELTLDPTSTGTTDCSIVCPTDPGTFSLFKATDPTDPTTVVPTTSPISLCAGEGFSIFSNQDYVLPEDTISYADGGDSVYTAQLMFLLYTSEPVGTDPASDPGFTGSGSIIIPSDSIVDLNSPFLSPILDSLNINCGTVWFVPVTGDDGIGLNGNIPGTGDNGTLNYDLLGDGCIGFGDAIEVRYNCELTVNGNILCTPYPLDDRTISINVNGGAEGDVFAFTYRDGILSDDTIQTPDVISVSGLEHLDTVELYFEDEAGCFDSLKVNFSIPQFVDVTVQDASSCITNGYVAVEADPLTGNGGIDRILMNGVVEQLTIPVDTLFASGGTQVLILLEDQFGCWNDSIRDIMVINGNRVVASVVPDSTFGVSCNDFSDGRATVTAIGLNQFGNPSGVPITSFQWTHGIAPPFGGTALDSMITGALHGTWTMTATGADGCTSTLIIEIENPDTLEIELNPNSPQCNGDLGGGSIAINVKGGTGAYSYEAFDANLDPVTTFNNTVPNIPAGFYTINVVDENGCFASETQTLLDPLPISGTFTQSLIIDCYGDSTGFITTDGLSNTQGPVQYSWDIPGSTVQLPSTPSISNLPTGQYNLQVVDSLGCKESWLFFIDTPDSLYFDQITLFESFCRLSNFQNGKGIISVSARGGTGSPKYTITELNTGNKTNLVTWPSRNPGPYNLTVTDFNGCVTSKDVFLDSINPEAGFTVESDDFEGPEIYEGTEPLNIRFTNTSKGYFDPKDPSTDVIFDWTFDRDPLNGDANWFFTTDSLTRPDTVYTGEQTFIACISVRNFNDCADTSCVEIISRVEPELILPNVFTPGEAPNEEFFFPNMGVNVFQATIFNRYGVPVFEFTDITDRWDGTHKDSGKDCSDGVYYYTYSGTATNGKEYSGEGSMTLLRSK